MASDVQKQEIYKDDGQKLGHYPGEFSTLFVVVLAGYKDLRFALVNNDDGSSAVM